VSEEALALARRNFARTGFDSRIGTLRTDWFAGLRGSLFDAIVSNPPYIPSAVIDTLEPCVRDFEPRLALDGGPDGLAAYRILFSRGGEHLKPGGFIACEIGCDQGEAVCAIARQEGFLPGVSRDYAGLDRIVIAYRKDI
ncbi:MAG: peptide chain release factor N(5)-glutamine methyltransferase, partial [Abditibacteriota bacterium]|nr:peptide chain release factor N(5)-glutamine methyltransferase [Abditibacteriota bacterium]